MQQPPGFVVKGSEQKVYRLYKSLYGLKQAAKACNQRLNAELERQGFRRCESDPCLYVKLENGKHSYVLVYVDDILVASEDNNLFTKTEKALRRSFTLTSLGEVHWYLGMEVKRNEKGDFFLSQERYIEQVAKSTGLAETKPSRIPLDPGYHKHEASERLPDNKDYQKLMGQLLYVSVNTRPDISAAVSILSRKTSCPTKGDWVELKRVARYLMTTKNLCLRLSNTEANEGLLGFCDADWAECRDDRKSNSGFLMKYNGGTISWACRKQTCVSLSTAEAEFVALSESVQEMMWLKRLLCDLDEQPAVPTIYEDNQSALKMLDSEKFSNRTKHIDTRFHFARDMKTKREVDFVYCCSEDMVADLLTKPLGAVRLGKLRTMSGIEIMC